MKQIIIVLLLSFLCFSACSSKNETEVKDFSKLFGPYPGTIVIYDASQNKTIVYNKKRSTIRFSPFSTFKIAHSLIALETQVIQNVDAPFFWDKKKYPEELWWPSQWKGKHTMRTAIKFSVVPFYREIASHIGKRQMQKYLNRFDYGNKDISSGLDQFWLKGSLKISAMEQVEFLKRFYSNKLGVNKKTTDAVNEILILEKTNDYTLSAKTGAGSGFQKNNPNKALGWLVGYIEKTDRVYFFALNIEGESFKEVLKPRMKIAREIFKQLKIIE